MGGLTGSFVNKSVIGRYAKHQRGLALLGDHTIAPEAAGPALQHIVDVTLRRLPQLVIHQLGGVRVHVQRGLQPFEWHAALRGAA